MGEALVITSGKGGAGKSTLAVNLGLSLWQQGKTVVLIDADTGLRSLDVMMGLENRVVYDLCDVAEGVCRVKQALVRDREHDGLFLMAAAQTRDSGALTPVQMEKIVSQLKRQYDFVLIDCPAGVGRGFRAATAAADRAILVVLPDVVSLRDAERVQGLLERQDILSPMLVVNRALPEHEQDTSPITIRLIAETLGLTLLGVVPEEAGMYRAMSLGRPVAAGNSPAAQAYRRIVRRLLGETVPIPRQARQGRVRRWLGKLMG